MFFAAGLFIPALPWAPPVALLVSAVRQWRGHGEDGFLARWWEVSRPRALAIIAWRLGVSVAADTLAMLLANWIMARF